jgi:tight adherence protein C
MATIISIFIFFACALLLWGLFPDPAQRTIRRRLLLEMDVKSNTSLLERLVKVMAPLNQRLPLAWYTDGVARQLERAGLRVHPMQFLVVQEFGILVGAGLYFVTRGGAPLNVAWVAMFMVGGYFVPQFWLNSRIQQRRMAITRDLPEVVDLLNLCVGAGSDFMNAMARIVREFRPCPVREELGIVLQEIRIGKRRRDALRSFANRTKTPEANTFARTLIQGDRMGTGLTEALQVLSEDMRLARYHWAERYAQQAPIKMLLPLLLSLAAALIIVTGPILVQFLRGGFGAGGMGPR